MKKHEFDFCKFIDILSIILLSSCTLLIVVAFACLSAWLIKIVF